MASFLLIRHKVRDFSKWKRGYDAHLPKRVEAGLAEKHLFRGAHDSNEVVLLFEAKDLNRAKGEPEARLGIARQQHECVEGVLPRPRLDR